MPDDPNDYEFTWQDRLAMRNRFTMWVATSLMMTHHRLYQAYDWAMVRFWPYNRYPEEWRSLFKRGG